MLHLLQLAGAYLGLALASAQSLCTLQPPVEQYLYVRYLETPKVDSTGDFTSKDEKAADRAHLGLKEYVIGGEDRNLKLSVYYLMHALELEGFHPGITSAYRDDYRQGLASGRNKNRPGHSFHGGSRVGGWGHGLAMDIVALAPTRQQQLEDNPKLWAAIDRLGPKFGLGRPYGDRDGPHVAPLTSPEFKVAANRLAARELAAKKKHHKVAKHHIKKKEAHVASR